jgi:hypothetical protein
MNYSYTNNFKSKRRGKVEGCWSKDNKIPVRKEEYLQVTYSPVKIVIVIHNKALCTRKLQEIQDGDRNTATDLLTSMIQGP